MPSTAHQSYTGANLHIAGPYAAVRVAVTTNVTLASAVEDGDSLGGVTLNAGDEVGLFGQSAGAESGVWVVAASGAPTRATWFNSAATMRRYLPIFVLEGDLAGHTFVHTTAGSITPGTTALTFVDSSIAGDTLGAHLADTTDSHDASAISFTPAGSIAATDVQAALAEVDSEKHGNAGVHSVAQPVAVHKNGTLVGTRKNLNLIEGSNVTLTVADDAGDDEVDVTIAASGGGGGSTEALLMDAHNGTGGSLVKGTAVRLTYAATGGVPEIEALDASSGDNTSVGVVAADIADGADGSVQLYGVLSGLDTSAFAAGDQLYSDASGALTATISTYALQMGVVLTVHATTGTILVAPAYNTVPPHAHLGNTTGTNIIDDRTEDASPATGDFVLTHDVSAGTLKKVQLGNLPGGGGGSVVTDTIFDAKGDLPVGTGSDTAARLAVGANDRILMADSGEATGLKWVASQTPSTQAFGDAAAEGTADTYARGDHKHAMPADPVTAHVADATDAHDASAVSYDNTSSGLAATDVQAAIDELDTTIGGLAGGHTEDHDHDGSPTQKLAQANTHEGPDTDTGTGSLHHTLGTGANQAAAGNHTHAGSGALTLIDSHTVGAGGEPSKTFSGIAGTGKDLVLVVHGRSDTAATFTPLLIQLATGGGGVDTGSNYHSANWQSSSTTPLGESLGGSSGLAGTITAASSPANVAEPVEITFPAYAGTTFHKRWSAQAGMMLGTATSDIRDVKGRGRWANTGAITSILAKPSAGSFVEGTTLALYRRG